MELRWRNTDAQVQGQAVRAISAFVAAIPPRPFPPRPFHLQVLYFISVRCEAFSKSSAYVIFRFSLCPSRFRRYCSCLKAKMGSRLRWISRTSRFSAVIGGCRPGSDSSGVSSL